MKNNFDSIDKSLEIVDVDPKKSSSIKKEVLNLKKESLDETHPDTDYLYTRDNLYTLIEKGQEALTQIIDLAQQSDSPRAYEVAGQLIKNVGDVTDKLIDLQQKMKKLKEEDHKGPKNVTNALFVGSTADLQKMLKNGFGDSK